MNALIAKGADIDIQSAIGWTPLIAAVKFRHIDVANALIETGSSMDDCFDSLITAANNGHVNIAKRLIEKGVDVERRAEDGRKVLCVAAENGHIHLVNALIEAGADINAELEGCNETALTLMREELVLTKLAKKSLWRKTFIREEDVKNILNVENSNNGWPIHDLVEVVEKACPSVQFSLHEKLQLENAFEKVPMYRSIRENLLKAGGYDVRNIKHQEIR